VDGVPQLERACKLLQRGDVDGSGSAITWDQPRERLRRRPFEPHAVQPADEPTPCAHRPQLRRMTSQSLVLKRILARSESRT
jgi:hypothetical protein